MCAYNKIVFIYYTHMYDTVISLNSLSTYILHTYDLFYITVSVFGTHYRSFELKSINQSINIIMLTVLYVCEAWPLTFLEKHRLRVLENRVFR
jgi:hypothetical protein